MSASNHASSVSLAAMNHCDGQRVAVDWPIATEAGREQKLAVTTELDCALDGFDRERKNILARHRIAASVEAGRTRFTARVTDGG
jgi:hypothetical protein